MNGIISFFTGLAKDPRIPSRDKKLILFLLFLVISPFDLIPDWIPFFGQLDDIMYVAIIGDYFFRILDPEIVLGRWPFGMKSYQRIKRFFDWIVLPVPLRFRNWIWKFKISPYR